MTVATQVNKVQVIGTGATRTHSFSPMVLFAAGELEVISSIIATGVETIIPRGTGPTDYLLNLNTFPGTGTIDFPAAGGTLLPTTERITMIRRSTLEQLTDLVNQGPYLPKVQEDQFDKIVMLLLQQQEVLDRCIRVPRGELVAFDSELGPAVGSPSLFVRVNEGGTAFELVALTTVSGALSSAQPQQIVTTSAEAIAGTSADLSRADHVHQTPDLIRIAAFGYNATNFS